MSSLVERDARVVWHPYTQAATDPAPLAIVRGHGARVVDETGREYIDAISSWWVSIHGHAHPYLTEKVSAQLSSLEQVIFAGCTHEGAVHFAERLLTHLPKNQSRVFYSDNGSCAVEVALKIAVQYWHNQGKKRTRFIALEGGYHGDTIGAMSLGAGPFSKPFSDLLFDVVKLPLPVDQASTTQALAILQREVAQGDIAGFVFEPGIQGVSGMRIYPTENLERLLSAARAAGVLLIADEVLTGFMRTGRFFVCSDLSEMPDLICLSKGLSGGMLPLGVTCSTEEIFKAFLSADRSKMLLHGHSFSANPVAIAAALASLDLLERDQTQQAISRISERNLECVEKLYEIVGAGRPRALGTIIAFDLLSQQGGPSYYCDERTRIIETALAEGVLLRPLGTTVYAIPPYVISDHDLSAVHGALLRIARGV